MRVEVHNQRDGHGSDVSRTPAYVTKNSATARLSAADGLIAGNCFSQGVILGLVVCYGVAAF